MKNIDKISIFVGLDLSFNSTGITLIESHNRDCKLIEFTRLVYNPQNKPLSNFSTINHLGYTLPINMNYKRLTSVDSLTDLDTDFNLEQFDSFDDELLDDTLNIERYNIDQLFITTKLMVNAKRINEIVIKFIESVKKNNNINDEDINMIFNIEGNILGGEKSSNQLRVVGGLIMLNQEIRHNIIRLNIDRNFNDFKLFITSPTELKMYFTDDGKAEKIDMINTFNNTWNGKVLIPESDRIYEVNDVVDSFALAVLSYEKYFYTANYMAWLKHRSPNRAKVKKPRKRKPKVVPLISQSITNLIDTNQLTNELINVGNFIQKTK